ncbi:MAG: sugar phosphate isomerase/epimerase [Gemmatales bacterium]|nr:sugar phosphate isomerase/epimerase [Gemmatales bacterium]MDW8222180.1 sugar phosphate isomerase/epimerase [Gemmatales bacterium]
MPFTIALYSGNWCDLSLQELAQKASEWGYQALELECSDNHLVPRRAIEEEGYISELSQLLESFELQLAAVSCEAAGMLLTEGPTGAEQARAAHHLLGDGTVEDIRQRATTELLSAAQAAQRLGVSVLVTASGCPMAVSCFFSVENFLPHYRDILKAWVQLWGPVLDEVAHLGVRLALLVQPGQMVWEAFSADLLLEALGWRSEVGLAVDIGALYWQGADPAHLLRRFADRVFHVRITDVAVHLTGHNSVLSPLPPSDPRRGWEWRSPGRGQVDFEAVLRALHDIGYDGPLSVAWRDELVEREFGAADASQFLRRLDFPTRPRLRENLE